jgi:hypothetical protein
VGISSQLIPDSRTTKFTTSIKKCMVKVLPSAIIFLFGLRIVYFKIDMHLRSTLFRKSSFLFTGVLFSSFRYVTID